MIQLILVLIIAVLLWMIFKPDFMPKPPNESQVRETIEVQAHKLQTRSSGWLDRARAWLPKRRKNGPQLRAWLQQEDLAATYGLTGRVKEDLAQLQAWVQGLSDKDLEALTAELTVFCARKGITLSWLFDAKSSVEVGLSFVELVVYYALAVRERFLFRPAAALRAWEQAPRGRAHRAFAQKLYEQLVEAGLAEVPTRMLFASPQERQAELESALLAAIAADREQVIRLAGQVLAGPQAAAAQPKKAKAKPVRTKEAEEPAA